MNKKPFTLVEVLVVVGIISILAGLVIPAVGMARMAGRRTECVSNQGQLMKLLTITMQANDNYLVSGGGYGGANINDPAWTRYLYDKGKVTNLKGFRCPGLPTKEDPDLTRSRTNAQYQSALGVVASEVTEGGKNLHGFDFRGSKRLSVITSSGTVSYTFSPNQLVIGGCSGWINNSSNLAPRANLLGGSTAGRFYIVHGDEFNMFFLDGHVESVTSDKATKKFIPVADDHDSMPINAATHIRNYDD